MRNVTSLERSRTGSFFAISGALSVALNSASVALHKEAKCCTTRPGSTRLNRISRMTKAKGSGQDFLVNCETRFLGPFLSLLLGLIVASTTYNYSPRRDLRSIKLIKRSSRRFYGWPSWFSRSVIGDNLSNFFRKGDRGVSSSASPPVYLHTCSICCRVVWPRKFIAEMQSRLATRYRRCMRWKWSLEAFRVSQQIAKCMNTCELPRRVLGASFSSRRLSGLSRIERMTNGLVSHNLQRLETT